MRSSCLLLLLAIAVHRLDAVPAQNKPVSNEDIRDAILSLVHTMRGLEDKLDRHEYRERTLGNELKRNFTMLERRVKSLESVKGTTLRLDDRIASVETILMSMDDRERNQMQSTIDMVAELKKRLPDDINTLQRTIQDKLNNMSQSTGKIEEGFKKLVKDNDAMKKANTASIESFERTKKQLSSSEMLLQQYEHKLTEFNDKIHTEIVPIDYKDGNGVGKAVEENKNLLNQVLREVGTLEQKITQLPSRGDLLNFQNQTTQNFDELHDIAAGQNEHVTSTFEEKLKEFVAQLDRRHDDMLNSINELSEVTENLTHSVATGYDDLKKDVSALPKIEEILVETAQGLLDTKRRVEYGVHEIKLEVGHLIKEHGDKMNTTIHDRFDTFELNILDSETGALANLTSKIGKDIDQVWRQIGIMHQQMSASTDTLNKLQNQTDSYVNGSLGVMDSMKSKVGLITTRMSEVDENLNYLMGRLSLVTQEFNNIKGGLGKALEEIRSSFMAVKDRIKDVNPKGDGPHQIPASSEDTGVV